MEEWVKRVDRVRSDPRSNLCIEMRERFFRSSLDMDMLEGCFFLVWMIKIQTIKIQTSIQLSSKLGSTMLSI